MKTELPDRFSNDDFAAKENAKKEKLKQIEIELGKKDSNFIRALKKLINN